jgi:hypothetical protein
VAVAVAAAAAAAGAAEHFSFWLAGPGRQAVNFCGALLRLRETRVDKAWMPQSTCCVVTRAQYNAGFCPIR